MPKVTERVSYNGFETKVKRLGLTSVVNEVSEVLTSFKLKILEEKDKNSAAVVRALIDDAFAKLEGWQITKSGDVDWRKCLKNGPSTVCIGVEVQVSGRSDMLAVDIIHLRRQIKDGKIDAGIIVVPDTVLGFYLTDRTPTVADAKRHVTEADFDDSPIMLMAFRHDGTGTVLPKKKTNTGKS